MLSSSSFSFSHILNDILKTRFHDLVTRLLFISSLIESLIWAFVLSNDSSFLTIIFRSVRNLIICYITSICLLMARKQYLQIESKGYSNIFTEFLNELFSKKYIVYETIHIVTSISSSTIMKDKIRIIFPDSLYLQFFKLYMWVTVPTIYTFQHICLDLDRLPFTFEYTFQNPQNYIVDRLHSIILKSAVLSISTILISIAGTLIFADIPFLSVSFYFKLSVMSFFIFIKLEFINLSFSAYMSIGCLYKGNPLSTLSRTPVETLLSGLTSKNEFTTLTAFQELSYRATSSNPKLRYPIYDAATNNPILWNELLETCLITIQRTNRPVEAYLTAIYNKFGMEKDNRKLNDTNDLLSNESTFEEYSYYDKELKNEWKRYQDEGISSKTRTRTFNSSIYILISDLFTTILQLLKYRILNFFFPSIYNDSAEDTYPLTLFETWAISKPRQANRLVRSPICQAHSIIALTGLFMNAIDEGNGRVTQSVGSVLTCLEKSINSLGKFNDWKPSSEHNLAYHINKQTPDVISILYDLSVSAFLELVLKYDKQLESIYLEENVTKLTEWVLTKYRC